MNILFISIGIPNLSSEQGDFYGDLLKGLLKQGDYSITVLAPVQERTKPGLNNEGVFRVLRVSLDQFRGNIPLKTKGIRILKMSRKYKSAYKRYLKEDSFDYVIMATPPSSLVDVVSYIKKKSGAKLYVILRDIHPECLNRRIVPESIKQRSDLYNECKKPFGVNIFIEKFLYWKSQQLYKISDLVGCMSPGNMQFLKAIAPYLNDNQILLLPNWYKGTEFTQRDNSDVREKYDLTGKFVVIFGGTIGAAQAVWNIAMLAKHNMDKKDVVFLVVGRGWKKAVLEEMAKEDQITNLRFMEFMPKEDYEKILEIADLGLISIDEKHKVPTCPSKIIGYMALSKPVLAMFNEGSDYGSFYIDRACCGLWSTGLDDQKMYANFDFLYNNPEKMRAMGKAGYDFYKSNLTTEIISRTLHQQLQQTQDS